MTNQTKTALLSKLRAPVADELPHWEEVSAKLERDETLTPLEFFIHENEPAGGDGADAWRDQLADALASAPVAGEALTRFCPECGRVGDVSGGYRSCCPDGGSARMVPLSLAKKCRETFQLAIEPMRANAAPQASEAVRLCIPPAKPLPDLMMASYHEAIGWNECRAAILQSAALSAQPGAQRTGGSDA